MSDSLVPVLSTTYCRACVILVLMIESSSGSRLVVECDIMLCWSLVMYVSARTETCWMV